jgi:hypothetical protein
VGFGEAVSGGMTAGAHWLTVGTFNVEGCSVFTLVLVSMRWRWPETRSYRDARCRESEERSSAFPIYIIKKAALRLS